MSKEILTPKEAEELQAKIYQRMSAKRKLEIASQLFLLAKKLRESKTVFKKSRKQ